MSTLLRQLNLSDTRKNWSMVSWKIFWVKCGFLMALNSFCQSSSTMERLVVNCFLLWKFEASYRPIPPWHLSFFYCLHNKFFLCATLELKHQDFCILDGWETLDSRNGRWDHQGVDQEIGNRFPRFDSRLAASECPLQAVRGFSIFNIVYAVRSYKHCYVYKGFLLLSSTSWLDATTLSLHLT